MRAGDYIGRMRLGYLAPLTPEEPARAARLGFGCLELHSHTFFGDGVYSSAGERQQIVEQLKRVTDAGMAVSAIAHYTPGLRLRGAELVESYRKCIDLAAVCGAHVVATIAARSDPQKTVEENLPAFREVYAPVAAMAEGAGVRIAIENWPGFRGYPWVGKTMAYSPEAWEALFDAVPSPALGLEFDPSHLVWQGIDWRYALERFAPRVHHVHAKDTEVFPEKRNRIGIFGTSGWWTYRLPGTPGNEVDWTAFVAALGRISYGGNICIEHEDDRYDPTRQEPGLARYEEGLRIAHACLSPLL